MVLPTYISRNRVPRFECDVTTDLRWTNKRDITEKKFWYSFFANYVVSIGKKKYIVCTVIDRRNVPPCNHLDIGALRLPTLARHQPITCHIPSEGRQPLRTDVQVVAGGGDVFSVYDRTCEIFTEWRVDHWKKFTFQSKIVIRQKKKNRIFRICGRPALSYTNF